MAFFAFSVWAFTALALGAPSGSHDAHAVNAKTSLTLLYQNNLNASDSGNHVGAILLDPMRQRDAREACQAIGESLLSRRTIDEHWDDFSHMFAYLSYSRVGGQHEKAYISDGVISLGNSRERTYSHSAGRDVELPVLCTQTSTGDVGSSSNKEILVRSGGNSYIGYRDQKSFRFLGIPYADAPERFEYAKLYSGHSDTIQATAYGPQCLQGGGGSEDCLFLNIQTPYIPKSGNKKGLKPVLFWIYGGGFTGGSSSDPLTDGGNLASREDIVVVSFNYRLSTLGFFAVPGTDIKGNYGISDQVVALEVRVACLFSIVADTDYCSGQSRTSPSLAVTLTASPLWVNLQALAL